MRSFFLLLVLAVVPVVLKAAPGQPVARKTTPSGCEFGVEGEAPYDRAQWPRFLKATRDLGADFIVCEFNPFGEGFKPHDKTAEPDLHAFGAACGQAHLTFFANQEITNFSHENQFLDEKGNDLLAHPDQTHRWDISGDLLDRAAKIPEFRGVLYDEPEHGQMRRDQNTNGGAPGKVYPYFAATDGMTLEQAQEAVYTSAKAIADHYRKAGLDPMTEHVFPVMFHTLDRAGFDTSVKFLKEGIDPVFGAIAVGAAKEYNRDFNVILDLWGNAGFPGHSPEEMRASLLYAYWLGASKIFVENVYAEFMAHPTGLLEPKVEKEGPPGYQLSAYGKVYEWFVKEYVPAHPRPYTFRDLKPEIGILRFDDSCWGQAQSWLPDSLYGAANLKTTPATAAWFGIWNVLTHGKTHVEGISFHNKSYAGQGPEFFYPLDNVVVYDDLAGPKEIAGLKLIFLTGIRISPETMKLVRDFVRQGGLCISLASLAPDDLKGKSGEVTEGQGRWLFTDNFATDQVRQAVTPFIGEPDEIRYRFDGRVLTVKRGKNNDDISVYLSDKSGLKRGAEPSASSRVW